MKVLFAINNDDISNAIIKKYQKDYKQILSYKNVYYFNAILKELQKDKSYDRVVISEDLEPFANNNYDTIDKFLFDKLDNISDEAINAEGNDTDIILICTDRRNKSDEMLAKLFGIGVYNAIIGQDRSIDEVCKLINKPRTKKDAKIYYKIDSENVNYQSENEDSVSEIEIQNILAHYARLGKNEDKYVDSFNNIVSQYTDNQLKIIIKYLPIGVKAVLETRSPKYQELVTGSNAQKGETKNRFNQYQNKNTIAGVKKEPYRVQMLKGQSEKSNMAGPVIIPSEVNKSEVKKLIENKEDEQTDLDLLEDKLDEVLETEEIETPKRGRGRPKKIVPIQQEDKPKRGRGRPRKNAPIEETTNEDDLDLFNIDISDEGNNEVETESNVDLFNLGDTTEEIQDNSEEIINDEDNELDIPDEDATDLFSLNSEEENDEKFEETDNEELDNEELLNNQEKENDDNQAELVTTSHKYKETDFSGLVSKDKKIVSFVGTTKNGTSFIVNNAAHLLASRGIKTAVLDMTKTKNAYYFYTNSDENLIKAASECIPKLKSGIAEGIKVNNNLDIYVSIPESNTDYSDVESIIGTLMNNYSIVLIDCDFDTPMEYFEVSQEIYLVQSMDVLTMQPLTAFLRNLQSKGILKQEKLKIVINKGVDIKSVSIKKLIGGISTYNDPSLTYMKELFDKDSIKYCIIHFEIPNYIKYLDSVIKCELTLNGYTKQFIQELNQLGNMIYPVLEKTEYSPRGNQYGSSLPSNMNDTLNKMKKKYQ